MLGKEKFWSINLSLEKTEVAVKMPGEYMSNEPNVPKTEFVFFLMLYFLFPLTLTGIETPCGVKLFSW